MVPKRKSSKFRQGVFQPRNPSKYRGDAKNIIYRSSWELKYLMELDSDPEVVEYSSEEVVIPYRDHKNVVRRYFVDFWVKKSDQSEYLIEIKPKSQTLPPVLSEGKKTKTKINQVLTWDKNQRKWAAARKYCEMVGMEFVILTEDELNIPTRRKV